MSKLVFWKLAKAYSFKFCNMTKSGWQIALASRRDLGRCQHGYAVLVSGDPDVKWFFTRMKIWQTETEVCHGQWVRFICNLGVADIVRVKSARQLFVNKIRLEQDPVAFRCLELWYHGRLRASTTNDRLFNATFYASLPFATNHV